MAAATAATKTSASGLRFVPGAGGGVWTGGLPKSLASTAGGLLLGGWGFSTEDIDPVPHHKAKRFRNDNQLEIRVKRPMTSRMPSAISKPPLATSRACICERKRL